ncbi:c-type cytochrome biogenesis protein CcmI [Pseudomonas sp. RIT-PI-S]|uniref:c-type cytochrome biogenesis protein CcmI n=1 Tax=Pseudomonas sp. RIT-PI-S TaxID=3035295 RepID=UPI0021DACC14|nr:c-type cytochrome biogenesis protein CcmI [Pseudomonas sp. RIT-PI-S]
MIDFWVAAVVLLLITSALLAWPLRDARRGEASTRSAVNLSVYEERLALLREEHRAGRLDAAGWASAQAEAGQALLAEVDADTATVAVDHGGRRVGWAVVVLVPLAALALYLHFGALDRLRLSRELATPAATPAQMLDRLERTVQAQPDAPDALYLLARTYMAQNRAGEAVPLFERAAQLAGRPPELLGQWAQAKYFAAGRQWSGEVQALVDEALQGNPNEGTSLGLLGIAAFEGRHWAAAVGYWQRLQAGLAPTDPARAALQTGIDRARRELQASGEAEAPARTLRVRVELAPALAAKVSPSDAVFVFAKAVDGPRIPLAVKRLRVADLPASVSLSDADAMQPALKLSAFGDVQLMARVSRAGQPTQGEWIGVGVPVAGQPGTYTLIIDSPEH